MDAIIAEAGQLTPVDTVTYPHPSGDFVLHARTSTESGRWVINHHAAGWVESFEFDTIPQFLEFLDARGVSRTIG